MPKYAQILFFLFVFITKNLFAQIEVQEHFFLNTKHGLSQNHVTSITKDYYGYMWFGTIEGLNKDDGLSFSIFKHKPTETNTISSNTIKVLLPTKENLWIGTINGLNIYNYETKKILQLFSNKKNSLSSNYIKTLCFNNEHEMWIGTANGLNLFDINTKKCRIIKNTKDENSLSHNNINKVIKIDSILWIATKNGLNKYNINENKFIKFFNKKDSNILPENNIRTIFAENNDTIWVGTGRGLSCIIKNNIQNFKFIRNSKNILTDISSIIKFEKNTILIGTLGNGVFLFNKKTQKITCLNKKFKNSEKIRTLYFDGSNLLWIGTIDNGVAKYTLKKTIFTPIIIKDIDNLNLTFFSFWEDKNNIIWAGTRYGLVKYNRKTGEHKISYIDFTRSEANAIRTIAEMSKNELFIGTEANGLFIFNKQKSQFRKSPLSKIYPKHKRFMVSFTDDDNNIWFGSDFGTLFKYDKSSGSFTKYDMGVNNIVLYSLSQYSENEILVGTINNGLWILNTKTNKFTRTLRSIGNITVSNIKKTRNNRLFISTFGLGLLEITDLEKGTFIKQNIDIQNVYTIVEDKNGTLWLSTNLGLIKYNLKNKKHYTYYAHDGLQSNEFNGNAKLTCYDEKLVFGGIKGFNLFEPNNIPENFKKLDIHITELKIFNKIVEPNTKINDRIILKKSIEFTKKINLTYKESFFSIKFACLDFYNSRTLKYRYKLQEFDKEWIYTPSNNRTAMYSNVPHGKYKFIVQAIDNRGNWGNIETSLIITISPPFWKTWYFYVFSSIAFFLLIFLIIKANEKRLINEKRKLEKIINQRTKEIASTKDDLNKEKEFTDLIIQNAHDGIVMGNIEGYFTKTNPAFRKMTGYSKEECEKLNSYNITPKKWHKAEHEEVEILKKGYPSVKEKEYIRKDGTIVPVRLSSILLEDKKTIISVISDITIRKAYEIKNEKYKQELETLVKKRTKKLQKAKTQAENADKLKSAFLANMSHEIRTPLNAILGFTQLLEAEDLTNSEKIDYINYINKGGQTLLRLIDDIIDIAKIEANQLTIVFDEFNVNEIITDVVNFFEGTKKIYEKEFIEIKLNIPNLNYNITADLHRFKQVMNNLINNALKFTDEGYIEVGFSEKTINSQSFLEFFIKDTGIGIPSDKINKIFDRFNKLSEDRARIYSGTGLGLTICKTIVNMHKGEIWVKSSEKGSEFYFTLPIDL